MDRTRAGDAFKQNAAGFAVERWCFRKAGEINEAYADVVAKMKQADVTFCR